MLIVTRFSVLGSSGFKSTNKFERFMLENRAVIAPWIRKLIMKGRRSATTAEKAAFLFNERRMQQRFALFEHICLKSLAAQTDRRFRHLVLTSTEAPIEVMDRLRGLSERFGFDLLQLSPTDSLANAVAIALKRLRDQNEWDVEYSASMRLDDDDAIGIEIVSKVHRIAQSTEGDLVVSPSVGRTLQIDRRSFSTVYSFSPFTALGLTLIERDKQDPISIFGLGNHRRVAEKRPVFVMSDQDAYVVTAHNDNDSLRLHRHKADGKPLDAVARDELRSLFGIDIDGLAKGWLN